MKNFSMTLTRRSTASPEAIYDVLADLRSHLTWGGAEQRFGYGLLSLDAPAGPATTGTSFTSTGGIPMSPRRWEDRSAVTLAVRPSRFEFVTYASVQRGKRSMQATYAHRYEIASVPGGSTVTYTFTQLDLVNPILRLALPVMRTMTWRLGLPFMAGRGFRNLLATAEGRTTSQSAILTPAKVEE
jgi:hypothetical protein